MPKRVIKIPYYECGFCGDTFDADSPRVVVSPSRGREFCPHDGKRLEEQTADVVVG
jgi:hypothetical protein